MTYKNISRKAASTAPHVASPIVRSKMRLTVFGKYACHQCANHWSVPIETPARIAHVRDPAPHASVCLYCVTCRTSSELTLALQVTLTAAGEWQVACKYAWLQDCVRCGRPGFVSITSSDTKRIVARAIRRATAQPPQQPRNRKRQLTRAHVAELCHLCRQGQAHS